MLQCSVKKCKEGSFPLRIVASEVAKEESDFNEDFLRNVVSKLEWSAFVATCTAVRKFMEWSRGFSNQQHLFVDGAASNARRSSIRTLRR